MSNRGDARADVTYQFRFTTKVLHADTFLYNTGPLTSINDPNWNRPQFYSVTRIARGKAPQRLATNLACPPVNVGTRSTPNYGAVFTPAAVHPIQGGRTVFAGQRGDAFYVDLGSVFDLGALRPFQNLHLIPLPQRRRGERAAGSQRAHHRDPGADLRREPQRRPSQRPDEGLRPSSACGPPPAGRRP